MGETGGGMNSVEAKLDVLVEAVQNTGEEVRKISAHLAGLAKAGLPERKKEEKKVEKKEDKFPYDAPVSRRSSSTTIERLSASLPRLRCREAAAPIAVAIGPYHRDSPQVQEMEVVKRAALEEFRRGASQHKWEAVQAKVLSLVGSARSCYAVDWTLRRLKKDEDFAEVMLVDGWFLLQLMVSMCPEDPMASPDADLLMRRPEVHKRINYIARDVLLFENQLPWIVLEALMELWPPGRVPVERFLRVMASDFHVGNQQDLVIPVPAHNGHDHLLGFFYRCQVGAPRTESLRVPRLSSMSSTAVELAEMGVKLTGGKTKDFGDMRFKKRKWLGLSGELSLAPLVLNFLTTCWLINMAAHEACLGASQADNFAVSSYVSVVALLMNREEDVQELRAKGVVHSVFSDSRTLDCFKELASHLHVGHRYYQVFQQLDQYRQERWLWIAVHRFLYKNVKTILAVLSVIGVLAGLFQAILSVKPPQQT